MLNDIRPHLERKLDILLDSGAIDFANETPYWGLPKTIMCVLAREMEFQHKHHDPPRGYKKKIDTFYKIM